MEKIAELVERVTLELIYMKYLPVCVLFNKNSLSNSMFIAHSDVVIESKLNWRCSESAFATLLYYYIVPVLLSSLIA